MKVLDFNVIIVLGHALTPEKKTLLSRDTVEGDGAELEVDNHVPDDA